ncbi:MAG: RNA polymerase sigma factor [Ruminococcaceae bacterium]|nr:RNA polymerase sigma factor [Oscillospiraceae bacterium]
MILSLLQIIENDEERNAINELFNTYFPKMQSVAYGILNNTQDAEDAAMETMEYICEHADDFVDYKDYKTLGKIFMCVKTTAIDMYRRNQRKNKLFICTDHFEGDFQTLFEEDQSLSDIMISKETNEILSKSLDQLEDMYKIPILLKYNYHMKNKDIAKLLKVDTNTVNGRIFRAKKLIKENMYALGYVK